MTDINALYDTPLAKPQWFPVPIKGFEDCEALIAPHSNPEHKQAYADILDSTSPDGKPSKNIIKRENDFAESLPGTVLLDWKGFTSGEKEFPYNRENAVLLLQGSASFREFVSTTSQDMRDKGESSAKKNEDDLKN